MQTLYYTNMSEWKIERERANDLGQKENTKVKKRNEMKQIQKWDIVLEYRKWSVKFRIRIRFFVIIDTTFKLVIVMIEKPVANRSILKQNPRILSQELVEIFEEKVRVA